MVALAEAELGMGHRKDAADLLRAAEPLSFAALASTEKKSTKVSPELEEIVTEEVEHLTRKAKEHWEESEKSEHHEGVTAIFESALDTSEKALDAGLYRQALELSRGAETLAHV